MLGQHEAVLPMVDGCVTCKNLSLGGKNSYKELLIPSGLRNKRNKLKELNNISCDVV